MMQNFCNFLHGQKLIILLNILHISDGLQLWHWQEQDPDDQFLQYSQPSLPTPYFELQMLTIVQSLPYFPSPHISSITYQEHLNCFFALHFPIHGYHHSLPRFRPHHAIPYKLSSIYLQADY